MSDFGEGVFDDPTPEETVAGRLADAGKTREPGHPAQDVEAPPSPGETLSRGAGDEVAPLTPGEPDDDVGR